MIGVFHLSRILARAAARFPEGTAVRAGPITRTYAELGNRVSRLAGGLRALGLEPGDRVAILGGNSPAYLELSFAAAQAALVLLPLNIRLAPAEILAILRATDCRVLWVSSPFHGVARELAAALPALQLVRRDDAADPRETGRDDYARLLRAAPPLPPPPDGDPGSVVQIFFTSGTTGVPKGVCLTSSNLVAGAFDSVAALEIGPRDVWLHAAPMFHLVDAFAIWTVTLVGGRHVVAPFDADGFADLVAREGVTKTSLPPTLIDRIVSATTGRAPSLASLERITYGGSPMSEAVHERAARLFPCPLLQAYGITETSGLVCQQRRGDYRLGATDLERARRASVGRPTPATELRIVDDRDRPVPSGAVGELLVSGPKVMSGYWRDREATAAVLADGWYRTGDLGFADAGGHVYLVDRRTDMIISGGENVYSIDVENALASHPAVLEAAALGVPSERWGEEVCAVVTLRPGASASAEALIAHCRRCIGGYKVPRTIVFWPDPLPKTGPGKVAKHVLRASMAEVRRKD